MPCRRRLGGRRGLAGLQNSHQRDAVLGLVPSGSNRESKSHSRPAVQLHPYFGRPCWTWTNDQRIMSLSRSPRTSTT